MVFCQKCGFENIKDAKFCENCGNILDGKNKASKNSEIQKNPLKKGIKKTSPVSLFIIAIIVIAGSIGLYLVLNPTLEQYNGSGVTFDYIKGWNFGDGNSSDELINGSYEGVVLSIYKRPATLNLTDLAVTELQANNDIGTVTEKGFTTIDGQNAYQITTNAGKLNFKTYLFIKNGNEYKLLFAGDTFSYRRSIDTIVKSFHVN